MSLEEFILYITGDKGGVGKTMTSIAALDVLQQRGWPTLVIETDTSNPDVAKLLDNKNNDMSGTELQLINLDRREGWLLLGNAIEANAEALTIINGAARSAISVDESGQLLLDVAEALGKKLVVLWVINTQRDSVELLRRFVTTMPNTTVHVLKNLYFGSVHEFDIYDNSKLKSQIERTGGKSLFLPVLADRVSRVFYSERLSIATATKSLPVGDRVELIRWRKEIHALFNEILPAHSK